MRKPPPGSALDDKLAARRKRDSFFMDVPASGSKEFTSLNKKRDVFLIFCGTLSVLAGICGGLCAMSFTMALVEVRTAFNDSEGL